MDGTFPRNDGVSPFVAGACLILQGLGNNGRVASASGYNLHFHTRSFPSCVWLGFPCIE